MTVVVPWLLEREYRQHRMLDVEGLPPTFEAWHAIAIAWAERRCFGRRQRTARVVVHPAELEAWARATGRRIDEQARQEFAQMIWKDAGAR